MDAATADRPAVSGLAPDRFTDAMRLAMRAVHDPESRREIEASEDLAPAWERLQAAYTASLTVLADASSRLANPPKRHWEDPYLPLGGSRGARGYWARGAHQRSAELALALGQLRGIARLSPEQVAELRVAKPHLPPEARRLLGPAATLEAVYPVLAAADDAIRFHPRPSPGEAALPLDLLLRAAGDLDSARSHVPVSKTGSPGRRMLGLRAVTSAGAILASDRFLAAEQLGRALQAAYDKRWQSGHPITRTARGAFLGRLRDRVVQQAPPGLLVEAAACADGQMRAVAAASDRTPPEVYEALWNDCNLEVLLSFCGSPRFSQRLAYQMLDQEANLPRQITAVMLNGFAGHPPNTPEGSIHMGIRVLACKMAIAHQKIPPVHIYQFLSQFAGHPLVPAALWGDFATELMRRLNSLEARGMNEEAEQYRVSLRSFASRFTEEILARYALNHKERNLEDADQNLRLRFLEAHEFVRDERILDVLVEAAPDGEAKLNLLRMIADAEIKVTDRLVVGVFGSADPQIQEQGYGLFPNIDDEEVRQAAERIQARKRSDYEALRSYVLEVVVPEFEDMDVAARKLTRNRFYFLAHEELTAEELVEEYRSAARDAPHLIPEHFSRTVHSKRFQRIHDLAQQQPWEVAPLRPATRADQISLF